MNPARNTSGQAFVEWALIVPLFITLFLAIFSFAQWLLIHQRLQGAARQGAWLYSSGRLPVSEVKRLVQAALAQGHPTLHVPLENIQVGRCEAPRSALFRLDQVTVRHVPTGLLIRFFTQRRSLEESCIVKHAPSYWGFYGLEMRPPVSW